MVGTPCHPPLPRRLTASVPQPPLSQVVIRTAVHRADRTMFCPIGRVLGAKAPCYTPIEYHPVTASHILTAEKAAPKQNRSSSRVQLEWSQFALGRIDWLNAHVT